MRREITTDWVPRVAPGVVEEEVDDQLLIYHSRTDRVHLLNLAAAAVFDLCDGTTRVQDIIAALNEAVPPGAFNPEYEVPKILREMLDQGLLE